MTLLTCIRTITGGTYHPSARVSNLTARKLSIFSIRQNLTDIIFHAIQIFIRCKVCPNPLAWIGNTSDSLANTNIIRYFRDAIKRRALQRKHILS